MKAFDMGRFQRVVGVEGGRVTGNFVVLLSSHSQKSWVKPHEVTVWDDADHHVGRVLYSNDLTGSVKDGVADISEHMIAERVRFDVLDVMDEMKAALVSVVEAARFASPENGATE